MKKGVILISFIFLIGIIGFVASSFDTGRPSHELTKTYYSPGEEIKGWINISLDEEPADSLFSDPSGNTIELLELLKKGTYDYKCSITDCKSDYSSGSGKSPLEFGLSSETSKVVGIKFTEKMTSISSVSFDMQSTAEVSCSNQLEIDFENDGSVEVKNNKSSNEVCPGLKLNGCFDPAHTTLTNYGIGQFPKKHCQKIELPAAPGFEIGAYINRSGDSRKIKASIHSLGGDRIDSSICELSPGATPGEVSCFSNYPLKEKTTYYVCIYSEEPEAGNIARVRGYPQESGGCGFFGSEVSTEGFAFDIFAKPRQYGAFGGKSFGTLPNGDPLARVVEDYLLEAYGTLDCSDDCYFPIKFEGKSIQGINLTNLEIIYDSEGGVVPQQNAKFYELEEIPPKISSGKIKVSLEGSGMKAQNSYGNQSFELELDGERIFAERISIEKVPVVEGISPTSTASAFPTEFKANLGRFKEVTEFNWDFGDNKTATTGNNTVIHTYSSTGSYNMKITIKDAANRTSSKEFLIFVQSPREYINMSLEKKIRNLAKVNLEIGQLDSFAQNSLINFLEIGSADLDLTEIQRDYALATSETELNAIMSDLVTIKVPDGIITTMELDSLVFFPEEEVIDIGAIADITNEQVDSADYDQYIEEVFGWNQENLNSKVSFKELTAIYEAESVPAIRIFEISVNKKEGASKNPYFIVADLEDLAFKSGHSVGNISGYRYIPIDNSQEVIVFSTTEEVDFTNLPAFISPSLSELAIDGGWNGILPGDLKDKMDKWITFTLIIIVVLIIAFVVYLILQEWYKKKYETYLFKDRNNLFNLINYIENSKRKGLKNTQIVSKLKNSGWNSEQIRYAIRKHAGKRTGMIELLPIDKLFKKKSSPPPGIGKPMSLGMGKKTPSKTYKRF